MEFEEMRMIWSDQDEKMLYAIDEAALHKVIRRKSSSASRWLSLIEWMMIILNPAVAIVLALDTIAESGPTYQFVIVAMYLAYSGFGVYRRLARRQGEVHFEDSMRGDLEKGIWRIDYLIRQGSGLILWYLLPLAVVGSVFMFIDGNVLAAVALTFVLVPASYLGVRWEIRKWHLPKKQSLESLRERLTSAQTAQLDDE